MTHTVRFAPEVLKQLDALERYIAEAGASVAAARYVDAIVDQCAKLQNNPHRGARRDDIRTGLRTIGFRRRVTIAFEVVDDTVTILGVYYGGRDYEASLRDGDDPPSHT